MFMSQVNTEELLGRPFSDEQFWPSVELAHSDVWFFVSTAYFRKGGTGYRFYLYTRPSDLVALIKENDELFCITKVMAVTPPRVNQTGSWRMQRLLKLVALSDPNDLLRMNYIYHFENDLVYDTRGPSDGNDATYRQVLFSEELHACPELEADAI